MTQLSITCPHCSGSFELSEAFAAPLIKDIKAQYDSQLKAKEREISRREAELSARAMTLSEAEAHIEDRMAARERELRDQLFQSSMQRARNEVQVQMEEQQRLNQDLTAHVERLTGKERQIAEERAALQRLERDLRTRQNELSVEVERQVRNQLPQLEQEAMERIQSQQERLLAEKDEKAAQLQRRIDDLQRNAHQGSQQIQGYANETLIRERLAEAYPTDDFERVKTGVRGGDLVHTVRTNGGAAAGTIIWEIKQAKIYQSSWLDKLKSDRGRQTADVAVLVAPVLPEGIKGFAQIEGIWVVRPGLVVPLATALRHELTSLAMLRSTLRGRDTKATKVYDYLHGPIFRSRVSDLVNAAVRLRDIQTRMRDTMARELARADAQVLRMKDACFGLQGDLMDSIGEDIATIDADSFAQLENRSGQTGKAKSDE